jgi:hypothetical protein
MDVNRLKAILNKSKTIMSTVDGGEYKRGNIDESLLQQEGLVENVGQAPAPRPYTPPRNQQQVDPASDVYKSKVQSSRMPDAVKQAMLKNPIPQPDMSAVMGTGAGRSFTLEDLGYTSNNKPQLNEQQAQSAPQMVEQTPYYQQPPQQNYAPQQPPQQYYAPQPQAPSVSREEIKSIIKECLAEMMVNTISENSVKNTLKALISEGKLKVKKTNSANKAVGGR